MLDYTFHASSGAAVEWYFHDDDARISTPDRDRLSQLAVDVLADSGADGGIVSISLADPDIMAGLNADHMGVDAPTDVLSFPIDPFPEDGMPGVQRLVGDIMLCVAVAQAQCADHSGSFLDELALLVTHSCLHICGYDHAEPNEREQMWNRERELIAKHWGSLAADPWS